MKINDRIKEQLGSWWPLFLPFIESPQWDNIFTNLKMQSQANRTIIPKNVDVFRSFEYTDKDKLKAVFFLMDPYPTFKNDIMIADGVPMSCRNTGVLQPSLELFYAAIEAEYLGFDVEFDARPDNSYLLKEEGVLLMNTSMTVEKDKVGSHSPLWRPFMVYFIEEVLNKHFRGLPIILAGQSAQKLEKYFNPLLHHIKKIEHPVAASYQNRLWDHEGCFKWVNNIIRANNGPEFEVKWYRKKGEGGEVELPAWVTDNTIRHNENELPKAQDLGLPWRD